MPRLLGNVVPGAFYRGFFEDRLWNLHEVLDLTFQPVELVPVGARLIKKLAGIIV
jgi:hypothetical protein